MYVYIYCIYVCFRLRCPVGLENVRRICVYTSMQRYEACLFVQKYTYMDGGV